MSNCPFKWGELVTTHFIPRHKNIIRRVLKIRKDKRCSSGWSLLVEDHKTKKVTLPWLDIAWFHPIEKS